MLLETWTSTFGSLVVLDLSVMVMSFVLVLIRKPGYSHACTSKSSVPVSDHCSSSSKEPLMTHLHLMSSNKRGETRQILNMSSPFDKGATGEYLSPKDKKLPPCSFCCYVTCGQAAGSNWGKTCICHSKPFCRRSPQFIIQIVAHPSFWNQDVMCPCTNIRRGNFINVAWGAEGKQASVSASSSVHLL